MKRFVAIILLYFICLVGCGPKRRTNLRRQTLQTSSNLRLKIKQDRTIQKFKLELFGVECKFCARAALELLEQIPGVVLAEYVCDNSKNSIAKNSQDQDMLDQFGTGEIASMLDLAYSEAQTNKKLAYNNRKHDRHDQCNQANKLNKYGVNNFPGYVKLYYKPRENSQLSDVQIKQALNSDGFDLKFTQQI